MQLHVSLRSQPANKNRSDKRSWNLNIRRRRMDERTPINRNISNLNLNSGHVNTHWTCFYLVVVYSWGGLDPVHNFLVICVRSLLVLIEFRILISSPNIKKICLPCLEACFWRTEYVSITRLFQIDQPKSSSAMCNPTRTVSFCLFLIITILYFRSVSVSIFAKKPHHSYKTGNTLWNKKPGSKWFLSYSHHWFM